MNVHGVFGRHVELGVLLVPVRADFLPRTSAQMPRLRDDHVLPVVVQCVPRAGSVQSSWACFAVRAAVPWQLAVGLGSEQMIVLAVLQTMMGPEGNWVTYPIHPACVTWMEWISMRDVIRREVLVVVAVAVAAVSCAPSE